jgi:hypothetical protein
MPVPRDLAADIRAIELFNEKADKLKRLSFVRTMQSEETGWTLTLGEGGASASRYGPGNESICAFVLTIRFFVQDNETSSIRNMAARYRRLHDNSLISKELLDNFNDARNKLLRYLDSTIQYLERRDGKVRRITRGEIWDVFVYGGLAHANQAKKERFDEWQHTPIAWAEIENAFVMTLMVHLQVISYIQGLNKQVLAKLKPGA